MNPKISRNEKHTYSNEETLNLGEDENTYALINIALKDDSNIFFLILTKPVNKKSSIYHLKML